MNENERLASRLTAIATALKPPATNGHGVDDDPTPVTLGYLASLVQDMGGSIREELQRRDEQIAVLEQRLAAVENNKKGLAPLAARIASVEATQLTDGGVWTEGVTYRKNAVVTHGGNLWLCKRENSEQPPSDAWRLMNKTKGHR